jgi:hypothetical protein
MESGILPFEVTNLNVTVEEGVRMKWQGRDIDSGRLSICLGEPGSSGVIDYKTGKVDVEFRIRIDFPEFTEILDDMGADSELTAPVYGVIRSHGEIIDECHSLRLAGTADLSDHRLFDPAETRIEILAPTRCRTDGLSRPAAEIQKALLAGEPVTWNFNPTEKRVILVLPDVLGGDSYSLCLAGSYTFTAVTTN